MLQITVIIFKKTFRVISLDLIEGGKILALPAFCVVAFCVAKAGCAKMRVGKRSFKIFCGLAKKLKFCVAVSCRQMCSSEIVILPFQYLSISRCQPACQSYVVA
jgi:hypothetical protein